MPPLDPLDALRTAKTKVIRTSCIKTGYVVLECFKHVRDSLCLHNLMTSAWWPTTITRNLHKTQRKENIYTKRNKMKINYFENLR